MRNQIGLDHLFTKKHLLKYEVVPDVTAAASQTLSKLFHNALSS